MTDDKVREAPLPGRAFSQFTLALTNESVLLSDRVQTFLLAWSQQSRMLRWDRPFFGEFLWTWEFHHKLQCDQLKFAGKIAIVKSVGFYHRGDELYELDGVPGIWHERCLKVVEPVPMRVRADFNGLFGELLCLSHKDTCKDAEGNAIPLRAGMVVTAFDEDLDEYGNRDDLIASGTVEPSPQELRCIGSRWVLRIDANGVRHESELGRKTDKA